MVSLDVESLETLPPNTMLTVHITDKATVTSVFAHHCTIIITAMYRPYQPRPSWFSELSSDNGVSVKCQCVEHRFCTHEEADTCLLQHAKHAADSGAPSVVICLPDTDVTVICYHMQSRLQTPIYSRTGTQTRYVDISGVFVMPQVPLLERESLLPTNLRLAEKKITFQHVAVNWLQI